MQGITLVTFPAASTIFTSGSGYGLSAGEYGAMFVPQVIAALVASLAGATIAARAGSRSSRCYLRAPAWAGAAAFGLAGLACSALMPLAIRFGQEAMTAFSASVASGVIACYQVGYGIAAFGVGPLRSAGLTLPESMQDPRS